MLSAAANVHCAGCLGSCKYHVTGRSQRLSSRLSLLILFCHLIQQRSSADNWHVVYRPIALSGAKQTVSKHSRELEALIPGQRKSPTGPDPFFVCQVTLRKVMTYGGSQMPIPTYVTDVCDFFVIIWQFDAISVCSDYMVCWSGTLQFSLTGLFSNMCVYHGQVVALEQSKEKP